MDHGGEINIERGYNTKGITTGIIQMFLYMSMVPTIVFILGLVYRGDLILGSLVVFQIIMMIITAIGSGGLKLRYLINVWLGKLITLSIFTLTIYISLIAIRNHNIKPIEFVLKYLSIVDINIYKALGKYMLVKFTIEFSISIIKYLMTLITKLEKEEFLESDVNVNRRHEELEDRIISDDTGIDGKPKIDTKFYEIED